MSSPSRTTGSSVTSATRAYSGSSGRSDPPGLTGERAGAAPSAGITAGGACCGSGCGGGGAGGVGTACGRLAMVPGCFATEPGCLLTAPGCLPPVGCCLIAVPGCCLVTAPGCLTAIGLGCFGTAPGWACGGCGGGCRGGCSGGCTGKGGGGGVTVMPAGIVPGIAAGGAKSGAGCMTGRAATGGAAAAAAAAAAAVAAAVAVAAAGGGAAAAGAVAFPAAGAFTAWTRTPSACARSRIFFFSTRRKWLMWSMGKVLPTASASFTTCRNLAPPAEASSAPMSSAIARTPRSVACASAETPAPPSFAGSCEAPVAVAGGLFAGDCTFATAPGLSSPPNTAVSAAGTPGKPTFAQSPEALTAGVFTMCAFAATGWPTCPACEGTAVRFLDGRAAAASSAARLLFDGA
mmetsp:Transcript_99222/g.305899  ORF Transcript_99222/g.305899 Transcript_99222/m.305899 type:complete len:405 (-) Transcript_99222:157-1371(-)